MPLVARLIIQAELAFLTLTFAGFLAIHLRTRWWATPTGRQLAAMATAGLGEASSLFLLGFGLPPPWWVFVIGFGLMDWVGLTWLRMRWQTRREAPPEPGGASCVRRKANRPTASGRARRPCRRIPHIQGPRTLRAGRSRRPDRLASPDRWPPLSRPPTAAPGGRGGPEAGRRAATPS